MISNEIAYGLFLSYNPQILDPVDTEIVCLAAVMSQNLRIPLKQHLRTCLRIGISREDLGTIQQCIRTIASYAKQNVDDVGTAADIGDDEIEDTQSVAFL